MVLFLQLSKEGKSYDHMSSHKFHAPNTGMFAMMLSGNLLRMWYRPFSWHIAQHPCR